MKRMLDGIISTCAVIFTITLVIGVIGAITSKLPWSVMKIVDRDLFLIGLLSIVIAALAAWIAPEFKGRGNDDTTN